MLRTMKTSAAVATVVAALNRAVLTLALIVALALGVLAASAATRPTEAHAYPAVSSYYGYELAGSPTATGEPFDPAGYTAASLTYPLGTYLTVSYGYSSVCVRVNDRGPYIAGRHLDLSEGAAQTIGLTAAGVDVVDIQKGCY